MTDFNAYRGRRVLVTGGAGVIGRETLQRLVAAGADVLSADREPLADPFPLAERPGLRHLQIDLAEDDLAPLWEFRPQVIVHLAATFERAEETPDFWVPNWHDNVVLSHRLAEGARRAAGVEVLVFASSYLIYDPEPYLQARPPEEAFVLDEDAKQAPRNLCGAAKLYSEAEFAFAGGQLNGPSQVILARIFRVYGRGSRDVISRWVRAALASEPLTVYQRENRFDYIFAGDVAEALLRLAITPSAEGIVNVGSGMSRSIDEVLANLAASLPDVSLSVSEEVHDARFEASVADISRLREWTGWVPGVDLRTGIGQLVDWERGRAGD